MSLITDFRYALLPLRRQNGALGRKGVHARGIECSLLGLLAREPRDDLVEARCPAFKNRAIAFDGLRLRRH